MNNPRASLLLLVSVAAIALFAAAACGAADETGDGTPRQPTSDTAAPTGVADLAAEPREQADLAIDPPQPKIGHNVGDRAPDFTISFEDGAVQSSQELLDTGRPVFMFFFATWCPVCRRDLSQLKDVYPEFASELDFIAIGQDPTEPLNDLVDFRDNQSLPWPVALPGRRMLADLRITSQSYKIAFDSDGVIVYRAGYGGGDIETWKAIMADLVSR